jgi:uncharacterized protein YqfB (UPF0267 family)
VELAFIGVLLRGGLARQGYSNGEDNHMQFDPGLIKVIEVNHPEWILDARTKTAMMTVATWADYFRVGEDWHRLQQWNQWQHGKTVNEVSHHGEYTTSQGDLLVVCPMESEDVVCQVQVTEIRMVDCHSLTDAEVHELGYATREDYNAQWQDINANAPRGWFMRVMLVNDTSEILQ